MKRISRGRKCRLGKNFTEKCNGEVLFILKLDHLYMILATIIGCIFMHAAFGALITLISFQIPLNGFAHTFVYVNRGPRRGSQVSKS
jgi:hypothetical protein